MIQKSQERVKISAENIEDFSDYLTDYIPNHVDWIKKGNEKLEYSVRQNKKIDREAISQLVVGVHNLSLDLEELCDLLLKISDETDKNSC